MDGMALAFGVAVFLITAIATIILAKKTDLLRDAEPFDFGGAAPAIGVYRRPYSLAQSQMAWWFAIVIASFVFIEVDKGLLDGKGLAPGVLTEQALLLLGIGTGTALGATVIEQTKQDANSTLNKFKSTIAAIDATPAGVAPAPQLLAARAALAQQLASENFLKDILTDVDGVSLHRFQAFGWTIVLGLCFVAHVVTTAKMPELDVYTLAVLGISGGTYLGFKIPEKSA
jgi:hypothetical protein